MIREHFQFVGSFLRNPVHTGAIAPSSRWLAQRMTEGVRLSHADTVVELGPGTGAFTEAIGQAVRSDALFLAIELNEDFAAQVRARVPRAEVIHDSAEHLATHLSERGREHADVILCGLPWAGFPDDLQHRLMDAVLGSLHSDGWFTTFAYVHASWFPAARRYRRLLESNFTEVQTTDVVWKNVPPAFVYRCRK